MASETMPVFGMATGVLTKWNEAMEDQQHRIRLSAESVDCILPGEVDSIIYAGCADGVAYKVNAKSSVILKKYVHNRDDGVFRLEMDYQYHLVTADMESIKLWMTDEEEKKAEKSSSRKKDKKRKLSKPSIDGSDDEDEDDGWETESGDENDFSDDSEKGDVDLKDNDNNDGDSDSDSDSDESSSKKEKKKKRKRGKKSAKSKVYNSAPAIKSFEGL